jgi:polar amino acid transport system substrate-binding protein
MRIIFFSLLLCALTSVVNAELPGPAHFSTSNIEPWGYLNDKNKPDGLLSQLAEALAKETNIMVDNQIRPYPRVIHEIKTVLTL